MYMEWKSKRIAKNRRNRRREETERKWKCTLLHELMDAIRYVYDSALCEPLTNDIYGLFAAKRTLRTQFKEQQQQKANVTRHSLLSYDSFFCFLTSYVFSFFCINIVYFRFARWIPCSIARTYEYGNRIRAAWVRVCISFRWTQNYFNKWFLSMLRKNFLIMLEKFASNLPIQ